MSLEIRQEYRVSTEQFEGPLDLLLLLIEKNELDITRLSLACVADQFISYVEERRGIPLEHFVDFLDIASRLLLLKSKALLPSLDLTEEEEEEIADLEERLRIHALFQEKADALGELAEGGRKIFSRNQYAGVETMFLADASLLVLSADQLKDALSALLLSLPDVEQLKKKILKKVLRLEEKIRRLQVFLGSRKTCLFSEIVEDRSDRGEIAVSFLAVLELMHKRQMIARQQDPFGDIVLESLGVRFAERIDGM